MVLLRECLLGTAVFWWPVCLFLASAVSLVVLISMSFGFWTTGEKTVYSPADLSLQQGSPCSQAGFEHFLFSKAVVPEAL